MMVIPQLSEIKDTLIEEEEPLNKLVNGMNYAKKMEFIQFLKDAKVMNYKSEEFEINFYCDYDLNLGVAPSSKDDPILNAFNSENEF